MENTNNFKQIIDKEVIWDKTKIIMSKSDLKGNILYANEVFINVSGYEEEELMNKPHNILRHPDMPKVIFKLLWDNLNNGKNFHAIIKNRAKSGRYYWVITDFIIYKDASGEITGFTGHRSAIDMDIIEKHIIPLYKKLLQIEIASGPQASENYLIGFLEEKKQSYIQYIQSIDVKKNFFKRLFSRS